MQSREQSIEIKPDAVIYYTSYILKFISQIGTRVARSGFALIGDIIVADVLRKTMSEKVKADLDKLDSLRDLALCGPEEQREESQQDL